MTQDASRTLRALVVDDEPLARDYARALLEREPAISNVAVAEDAASALKHLHAGKVDVVFLDIRMPGLDGMDLARVLMRFHDPPQIVFVTAFDDHALDAFGVHAFDYLLKPVEPERLAGTIRRLLAVGKSDHAAIAAIAAIAAVPFEAGAGRSAPRDEPIAVERHGRTLMLDRSSITHAEAARDYTRLYANGQSHLVRIPMSTLEAAWRDADWLRIHRSYLVPMHRVNELYHDAELGWMVRLDARSLPVSRRHLANVRDRLLQGSRALRARP